MVNVLVTASSCVTSLNVFRALKDIEWVNLFSCDILDMAGSMKYTPKHFKVPAGTDPEYVESMLRICKNNKIDFVFPISDFELRPLSKNMDKFKKIGTTILISDYPVIEVCMDKLKTYDFFKKIGVLTAETWEINPNINIKKYPVIFRKMHAGLTKKNVQLIEDEEDLKYILRKVKEPGILSEYIGGKEFTIDILSSKEGEVLEIVPRERKKIVGGNSFLGEVNLDPKMISEAKNIAESMKLKGISCVQCRQREGKNYYFEINPRVSSGLDLTVAAGANTPLLCLKEHMGQKIKPNSCKIINKKKMVRYEDRIII